MKCITKDGQDILRVNDSDAEFLVRNCGYKYIPKKDWIRPKPTDSSHTEEIRLTHIRSGRIAKEEIKKAKDKNSVSKTEQETQVQENL